MGESAEDGFHLIHSFQSNTHFVTSNIHPDQMVEPIQALKIPATRNPLLALRRCEAAVWCSSCTIKNNKRDHLCTACGAPLHGPGFYGADEPPVSTYARDEESRPWTTSCSDTTQGLPVQIGTSMHHILLSEHHRQSPLPDGIGLWLRRPDQIPVP